MERREFDISKYVELLKSFSDHNKREVCHLIVCLKYYEDNCEDNCEDDETLE